MKLVLLFWFSTLSQVDTCMYEMIVDSYSDKEIIISSVQPPESDNELTQLIHRKLEGIYVEFSRKYYPLLCPNYVSDSSILIHKYKRSYGVEKSLLFNYQSNTVRQFTYHGDSVLVCKIEKEDVLYEVSKLFSFNENIVCPSSMFPETQRTMYALEVRGRTNKVYHICLEGLPKSSFLSNTYTLKSESIWSRIKTLLESSQMP